MCRWECCGNSCEYYAKDISKKIKSTFKAKGESGKHVASSPPYGYLKDSGDKNQWVIDEVAAPIVRWIFRMTLEGYGPYQIATQLSAEHIPIPAYHQSQLGVGSYRTGKLNISLFRIVCPLKTNLQIYIYDE